MSLDLICISILDVIRVHRVSFYRRGVFAMNLIISLGSVHCRDENIARAKLLAHLLSMPVQLKHLRIQEFTWLLNVVEYVSNV